MANNTYIGGEIKLIGGLSDLFAIDSKIVRYTKADNNGEVSVQEIIDELLRRISVLEGSKNNVASIGLRPSVSNIVYSKNVSPFTITAEVKPDTATDKSIKWESSSTDNLTVDTNGLVTFISAKTPNNNEKDSIIVRITAKSNQKPDISAYCDITVTKANNSITIKKGNENITGKTIDVTLIDEITLTATDSSESTINWVSDRTEILDIIENGKVQFSGQYKTGDVKITTSVSNSDNYKKAESQTTLKVSKATDEIYFELDSKKVTQINKTISTTDTNNSFTLKVTSKSRNPITEFVSSNSNVAEITKIKDGEYTIKMLKWYNSAIRLTADTLDDDKRYSQKTQSIDLKINPIEQTLSVDPTLLSWNGSEELDAKEITIYGCQTELSVTENSNITSSVDGSKVSIQPKSRGINTTVTINASGNEYYKAASVNVTVKADAQSIKYYWYIGTSNPTSIGTVANSTTDNWTELGTSLSGVTKIQAESPASKYGYWFVVIPSSLGFKPFNSDGSTDESGIWTSSTSTISGYTVWSKNDKTTKINQQFHK